MEDLKAISVRGSDAPQVLFTDALTGAQTVYYKLEITVPTKPARFDEISNFDGVYFFENRSSGEFVAVRPTLAHTDPETGDRYQMVSLARPAGYNLLYIRESELDQKYKIVPKSRVRDWWISEEKKIPPTEQKTIHLLSGALLPIWRNLKKLQQDSLNIVRTTTDDGIRLVGVKIESSVIGEIRRSFGIWRNSAETAEEIIKSIWEENESIDLLGEMKIRRTRFQGRSVIEVTPSSYEQIRELREIGLINIIQHSKQRFFLSEDEKTAQETLSKVLKSFPPLHLLKNEGHELYEQNTGQLNENYSPVGLPEWLIEPLIEEVLKITVAV